VLSLARVGCWLVLGWGFMPWSALAHAHLLSSEPPANAVIAQAPQQLRLKFSEPVEKNFSRVQVQTDKELLVLPANSLQWDAAGKSLQIQLPAHAAATSYQVQWSILAKDGHPGKGRLNFKVKPQ
jgi:methionine-rich copper-binding protein CopC